MDNVLRDLFMKADVYSVIFVYNLLSFNKNQDLTPLTDTGLFGALRAIRILVLEFLSKNEKRRRKRHGEKFLNTNLTSSTSPTARPMKAFIRTMFVPKITKMESKI